LKTVIIIGLVLLGLVAAIHVFAADEVVGKRPYEMDWAGRVNDEDPPLVNFENLDGWQAVGKNAAASFERTREQQIWGKYVGKLTYKSIGENPSVSFGPATPVKIDKPFDAVSVWIYGNNWGWAPDPNTPQVSVAAVFADSKGNEFSIWLATVSWEEWFLCQKRLTPYQIKAVANGAQFLRFEIGNCGNKNERTLYFDNLSVFTEQFKPLTFAPRKQRGISMFPGQGVGTNNGTGKLPFPNTVKTILPDNLVKDFNTTLKAEKESFVFTYKGADGTLTYRLTPKTGTFGDIQARWIGRGKSIRPCVDGGVYLSVNNSVAAPDKIVLIGKPVITIDSVTVRYKVSNGDVSANVAYTYRLWNKSLVIDTVCKGGNVAEVRYGHAEGIENPRLVKNPYYHYGGGYPAVVVSGPADKPLFLAGHTDWYLSNGSNPFAINEIKKDYVAYQGGVQYVAKTDGTRNDVYERFFISMSPRYEEVLPNIPNPPSPWKKVAGTGVWRAHGASDRKSDGEYWTNVYRYGLRKVIITDHETGWRDNGESFTFRTKTAPGRGGDQSQYDYARLLQDKLGFVYGPYNNFTDFAPVNEFWSYDLISRTPDKQLLNAWMRCYAPKPARAVEYCEKLAPQIQAKFKFSTAYCDVHTAVAPWDRVDYDSRVPGAGTFAATFYSYGEIMMLQKAAWNGPVYSEGNNHFWYCGLTDGNYGQDQGYGLPDNPWLVDIDLRKMHDLSCNFGMGNPGMFYGSASPGSTKEEIDAYYDRFFAATVAFGHPGFLTFEGGFKNVLRSYYMLQQLHSDYTQVSVADIRYADKDGKLLDTSAAVASGAYKRSQIVSKYSNGTVTIVNGSRTERFKAMGLDLPPNGYAGWTADKKVYVISGDDPLKHHRTDYADTPAYIYVDGRGEFTRFPKAASDGIGICRFMGSGKYEVIPFEGADCGFKIDVNTAVALDKDNKEIGSAKLRFSRGYVYVIPVEGAVSYVLSKTGSSVVPTLTSTREIVVPGETVVVKGREKHSVTIPADTQPGQRLWYDYEGASIDFTCSAQADVRAALDTNKLNITVVSHLASAADFTVQCQQMKQIVNLKPGVPTVAAFDLGAGTVEEQYVIPITVSSSTGTVRAEYGMSVSRERVKICDLPASYSTGMTVRGKKPANIDAGTGSFVREQNTSCGAVEKKAIFIHPPYVGGVGCAYLTYSGIKLPNEKAFFKAMVGKADGSDLGDGILFKIAVVSDDGNEQIIAQRLVTEHVWLPIEADLSAFEGKNINIRLITDVGDKDNSSGDWSSWADMRIESDRFVYVRQLLKNTQELKTEPPVFPIEGLTVDEIRNAKSGCLVYDGVAMSSDDPRYPTYGELNGIKFGIMTPARGDEVMGAWDKGIRMPLTPEVIKSLGRRNVLTINNPGNDAFKLRRFYLELDLADGRKASSLISVTTYTQPSGWLYGEGVGIPEGKPIEIKIWFDV